MKSSSTTILYWLEHPQPPFLHPASVCTAQSQRNLMEQMEWSICSQLSPTWSCQLLGLVTIIVILNSLFGTWNDWGSIARGPTKDLVYSVQQKLARLINNYYTLRLLFFPSGARASFSRTRKSRSYTKPVMVQPSAELQNDSILPEFPAYDGTLHSWTLVVSYYGTWTVTRTAITFAVE